MDSTDKLETSLDDAIALCRGIIELNSTGNLEDRLRRQLVAEEGDADLMGEGSDETLAFLLLRF